MSIDPRSVRGPAAPERTFEHLVVAGAPTAAVFARARQLAEGAGTLLLVGEAGTGKRALAEAIHRASARASGPLAALWAADVLDGLLLEPAGGALLRAFRGEASPPSGSVGGGTLVLVGLEALLPAEQAALLRGLRAFARPGATGGPRLDLRWILVADGALDDLLRAGFLRRDVCQRLGVVPLFLPALRDRPGELPVLVRHALVRAGRDPDREGFTTDAMDVLCAYDFPGNVRELLAAVDDAATRAPAGPIGRRWLPPHLGRPAGQEPPPVSRTLAEVEVEHIRRVLTHTHGNRSAAARILGVTRVGLLGKLRRFGIDIPPQPASERVA